MKKMSLGVKIAFGFGMIMIFLCTVAFIGYTSLLGVEVHSSESEAANELVQLILDARQQEQNFIIRKDETLIAIVHNRVAELIGKARELKGRYSQKSNKDQMDLVIAKSQAYLEAFNGFVDLSRQKTRTISLIQEKAIIFLEDAEGIHADLKGQLKTALKNANGSFAGILNKSDRAGSIVKWLYECRQYEKDFILTGDSQWMDKVNSSIKRIIILAHALKSRFKQQKNTDRIKGLISALNAYASALNQFAALSAQQSQAEDVMLTQAGEARKACTLAMEDQKRRMDHQILTSNRILMAGTTIVLILGILSAILITRSITGPVKRIIAGLNEGADEVASISDLVSTSSQALAEEASEQAASIEETASSMEEMASMTQKNAESADQADSLMEESNRIVTITNQSMAQLIQSMSEISKASEETSRIVKTIDEIAFQTNLLALNAAVEAARAGEAGAGFAVVADEVRNLALRASDAARSTASLIEGTVKKVKDGSNLVTSTNDAFKGVAEGSGKVSAIVSEIAQASKEQFSGIEQVNLAIAEIDKMVQNTAANAEQSASACEEMTAQADHFKAYVEDLILLVNGNKGDRESTPRRDKDENLPARIALD